MISKVVFYGVINNIKVSIKLQTHHLYSIIQLNWSFISIKYINENYTQTIKKLPNKYT